MSVKVLTILTGTLEGEKVIITVVDMDSFLQAGLDDYVWVSVKDPETGEYGYKQARKGDIENVEVDGIDL
jgi:hypothetical protein